MTEVTGILTARLNDLFPNLGELVHYVRVIICLICLRYSDYNLWEMNVVPFVFQLSIKDENLGNKS